MLCRIAGWLREQWHIIEKTVDGHGILATRQPVGAPEFSTWSYIKLEGLLFPYAREKFL